MSDAEDKKDDDNREWDTAKIVATGLDAVRTVAVFKRFRMAIRTDATTG